MSKERTSRSVHQATEASNDKSLGIRRDGKGYDGGDIQQACRQYLAERGITATFATRLLREQFVQYWDGPTEIEERDRRAVGRKPSEPDSYYPHMPMHPLPGMVLSYQKCEDEWPRFRIRYFETEYEKQGESGTHHDEEVVEVGRWSAQARPVTAQAYLRAVPLAVWQDPSVPLVIVEAPIKALALTQYGVAAVAKAGADAGIHDSEHPERLAREAARIRWRGRTVYLMMDSGQLRNPDVARGVGRDWHLLIAAGADVRVCYLPEKVPTSNFSDPKSYDQGPDDYLTGVYQRNLNRLSERLVAGTVRENLTEEQQVAEEERIERQARWFAKLALRRVLRRAKPGNPWDRIQQEGDNKEALLRELPFLACLRSSGEAGLARAARAWGRGGKGLLKAALVDSQAAEMKGEEQAVYRVHEGTLHCGRVQLASFEATITEAVTRDDGLSTSSVFRLSGALSTGANLPTIEVASEEYAKMDWPHMWGPKAYLTAGKGVRDHARVAIQELSTPTSRHVYTATGWREVGGRHVYMLPGGGIGPDGFVEAECDVAGKYSRPELPGSDADAREAVAASLSVLDLGPLSVTAPVLAMAYAAPLRPLLPHGLDFTLWLYGQTGSMKSSLAGVVQSHFGDYSHTELPGSWFSSDNQIELKLTKAADVLFTIDNMVPPKTGRDMQVMVSKVNRILQTIGDQQSRGRLDRNAEERAGRPPRAGVISTAEMLPPADNESTYGRIFAVRMERDQVDVPLLTQLQLDPDTRLLLRKALGGYVQWLARQDWDTLRAELVVGMERVRAKLRESYGAGLHPRLPTMATQLMAGVTLWRRYARSVGFEDVIDEHFILGIETALRDQPQPVAATAVDEWLGALRSLLSTKSVALADGGASASMEPRFEEGRHVPVVGRIVGEEVWLDPVASYQAVEKFLGASWRYTRSELHRQLLDATVEVEGQVMTILAAFEKDKTRRRADPQRRTGSGKERVLVLRRVVLGLPGGPRAVETSNADGTSEVDVNGDEDLTGQA